MTEPTDAEIVADVLAGRQERYAVLVRRYQEALFRHARGMVSDSDAAADLVQDAFVRAYERLDTCQEPARFGAWVFRIARNRCMDYLKDRRRRNVSLDDDDAPVPVASDDPESDLDRSDLGRAVERALESLPPAQREAFLLKHVEDLSYEEMAERLDTGISALKMRVMRAREALQRLLAERL